MLKGSNQLDERVPIEVGTIQVNFCKNPQCQNFGVSASTKRQPRGRGAAGRGRDTYRIVGSGRSRPMLWCSFCGQYPTIKSNRAIHEELSRFWKPFDAIAIATCPSQDCPNHHIDIEKARRIINPLERQKQDLYAIVARNAAEHSLQLHRLRSGTENPTKMALFSVFSSTRYLFVVFARWKGSPCQLSTGRSILFISNAQVL